VSVAQLGLAVFWLRIHRHMFLTVESSTSGVYGSSNTDNGVAHSPSWHSSPGEQHPAAADCTRLITLLIAAGYAALDAAHA